MRTCSVEGCENKHKAKGYCRKHYDQFKKHGHILEKTYRDLNEIIEYEDYAEIIICNIRCEEVARAIIDLECIDAIKDYNWHIHNDVYIINNQVGFLHRFIMNCPDDMVIDHINRNPLDNRRENLRICTQQQNTMNSSTRCDNTSGIPGVFWYKSRNKWMAYITINGKRKHLGYFKTKEGAVEARRQAEIEYFGEYRRVD